MRKILVVDDEPELIELVTSYIKDEVEGVEILKASSIKEAIDILEDEEDIVGILSDYVIENRNGEELFNINKTRWQKPFLFLTGYNIESLDIDNQSEISDFVINKPFNEDVLLEAVRDVFLDGSNNKISFYKKVRASLLYKYLNFKANIYVRLSDRKYVKVQSDESLNIATIHEYENKGVEFLYLESCSYEKFMSVAYKKIEDKFQETQKKATLQISADVLDYVHEGVRQLGISSEQEQLINRCVDKCVLELGRDPSLEDFLSAYLENEDYLVYHSVLALHLSYMIAIKINYFDDWVLEKLGYASLLHDIVLPDSNLSMVLDRKSSTFKKLTNHERKIVLSHPTRGANLVESLNFLPNDISILIREHHERPDGTGFPRGLNSDEIKPLSCLFIIALQAADYFFHLGFEKEHIKLFIDHLNENFDEGNFKAAKDVLVDLLKEQCL